MITGTIYQNAQMFELQNKWEQKKKSGNILQKNDRPLTQEERMLNDLKRQLENNRKAQKTTDLYNKVMSGEELSPAEEKELAAENPQLYQDYIASREEAKHYEDKLRNAETKEEVQQIHMNKIQGDLSKLKSIANDPIIPKSTKVAMAKEIQGDVNRHVKIFHKFTSSAEYAEKPTEEELREINKAKADEKKDAAEAVKENAGSKEASAIEDGKGSGNKETAAIGDGNDPDSKEASAIGDSKDPDSREASAAKTDKHNADMSGTSSAVNAERDIRREVINILNKLTGSSSNSVSLDVQT